MPVTENNVGRAKVILRDERLTPLKFALANKVIEDGPFQIQKLTLHDCVDERQPLKASQVGARAFFKVYKFALFRGSGMDFELILPAIDCDSLVKLFDKKRIDYHMRRQNALRALGLD